MERTRTYKYTASGVALAVSVALGACQPATRADLATDVELADSEQALTPIRQPKILGVGDTNFGLWSYNETTIAWDGALHSEGVVDVAVLPDGSLVGAGRSGQLVHRATLADGNWNAVAEPSPVKAVAVMPDGVILGVHMYSGGLLKRAALEGPDPWGNGAGMRWHVFGSVAQLRDVAVRSDGHIFLLTGDNQMYEMTGVNDPFVRGVSGFYTHDFDSIAFGTDDTLYAVEHYSHQVFYLEPGESDWKWLPHSRGVQSVAQGNVITGFTP
jgi:hypothetical protein